MGKVFLLLAGSLLIGFSGIAGTDSPHDKGFRFNFHIGMTGGLYGLPVEIGEQEDLIQEEADEYVPSFTFGLELGTRFTLGRTASDKISVALIVDWFGLSLGSKTIPADEEYERYTVGVLNGNLLEMGPSITYALNNKMAIDLYYQVKPTVIVGVFLASVEVDFDDPSVGLSHAMGVTYRYKELAVGLEPNFGKINVLFEDDGVKTSTSRFNINLGFKF